MADGIEPITSPLSIAELRAAADANGLVRLVFAIELYELACVSQDGTIDGLNEFVDANVWDGEMLLEGLSYEAVGVDAAGRVLIEVTANASAALDESNEQDVADGEEEDDYELFHGPGIDDTDDAEYFAHFDEPDDLGGLE